MRRPVRAALAVLTLAVLSALASITTAQEWKSVETAQPETTHTAAAVVAITPEPTPTSSRYTGIELTEEEVDTLARLVWLEARGEPFEGQVAVVEVVLNRILSPLFPDTVDEVVYQRDPVQFSPAELIPTTTAGGGAISGRRNGAHGGGAYHGRRRRLFLHHRAEQTGVCHHRESCILQRVRQDREEKKQKAPPRRPPRTPRSPLLGGGRGRDDGTLRRRKGLRPRRAGVSGHRGRGLCPPSPCDSVRRGPDGCGLDFGPRGVPAPAAEKSGDEEHKSEAQL